MPTSLRRLDFDEIDSTSLHARRLIERGEVGDSPLLIVAVTQSGGVGRMRKPWSSPQGGLWFTLIAIPGRPAAQLVEGLGLRIGVAVTEGLRAAVRRTDADRLKLKWPNDVLIDGRKVCGILTEIVGAGTGERVLIGVGINLNLNEAALPEALRSRCTTLRHAFGRDLDPTRVLHELSQRVLAAIDDQWPDPDLVSRANAMLHGVGAEQLGVLDDGTADFGCFVGLDSCGIPIVRTSRGVGRLPTTAI